MREKIKNAVRVEIKNDIQSFVSTGEDNRINIQYYYDKRNKHIYAELIFGDLAQGPPGYAHGGAIAAVLDETMGISAWMNNLKVMTRDLKISFNKAVLLNIKVYADAWIENSDANSAVIKGKLISGDRDVKFAEAEGNFSVLDDKKWKSFGIDTKKFISDDYLKK